MARSIDCKSNGRRIKRPGWGLLPWTSRSSSSSSRSSGGDRVISLLGHLTLSMLRMLPMSIFFIRIMHGLPSVGADWCDLDTGYTTITDGRGYPHNVYISVTRDGSIWIRAGADHESADWTYQSETRYKVKVQILGNEVTSMLKSLEYTDFCVLSDLDLEVNIDGGWHPSYLILYDPDTREDYVAAFKKKEELMDCEVQTNITLSRNKQGIVCNGGPEHVCGLRHLPDKGQISPTVFINSLQFDPRGPDHWNCEGKETRNAYSLQGSYYHVYIKVATCPSPLDSRMFGHGATLRAHTDKANNTVIIPDPTQVALRDGVIHKWQVFAKVVSIEHGVFLQVWRPVTATADNNPEVFRLVGQSFYKPEELRFQQLTLPPNDYIQVKAGDVLGIYFPHYNPLAWSSVPCASQLQQYKYVRGPSEAVQPGKTLHFTTSTSASPDACRHYSFSAVFANKTHAKMLEDWTCPTGRFLSGERRRCQNGRDCRSASDKDKDTSSSSSSGGDTDSGHSDVVSPGGEGRNILTEGTIPLHLILIIIGGLFVLLMIVGFVSYYKAIKS